MRIEEYDYEEGEWVEVSPPIVIGCRVDEYLIHALTNLKFEYYRYVFDNGVIVNARTDR